MKNFPRAKSLANETNTDLILCTFFIFQKCVFDQKEYYRFFCLCTFFKFTERVGGSSPFRVSYKFVYHDGRHRSKTVRGVQRRRFGACAAHGNREFSGRAPTVTSYAPHRDSDDAAGLF